MNRFQMWVDHHHPHLFTDTLLDSFQMSAVAHEDLLACEAMIHRRERRDTQHERWETIS